MRRAAVLLLLAACSSDPHPVSDGGIGGGAPDAGSVGSVDAGQTSGLCETPADCDDGDACTDDRCVDGHCYSQILDDETPCLKGECAGTCFTKPGESSPSCEFGVCSIQPCFADSDCWMLPAKSCHSVKCDPTGKQTSTGTSVHGCHYEAEPIGTSCAIPPGDIPGACVSTYGQVSCQ